MSSRHRYEVGAVILHSPLMSGMRVAFPATRRTWFFDAFPSIDKVPKVTSPVLVIHGTEDEVIDFSHGLTIYEKCPRAVEPLWVEVRCILCCSIYSKMLNKFLVVFFSAAWVFRFPIRALAITMLKCTRNI